MQCFVLGFLVPDQTNRWVMRIRLDNLGALPTTLLNWSWELTYGLGCRKWRFSSGSPTKNTQNPGGDDCILGRVDCPQHVGAPKVDLSSSLDSQVWPGLPGIAGLTYGCFRNRKTKFSTRNHPFWGTTMKGNTHIYIPWKFLPYGFFRCSILRSIWSENWCIVTLWPLQSLSRCCWRRRTETGFTLISLGGGFKHFLFSPLLGDDSILTNIFQVVETTN